jgi:hypothetical protein
MRWGKIGLDKFYSIFISTIMRPSLKVLICLSNCSSTFSRIEVLLIQFIVISYSIICSLFTVY